MRELTTTELATLEFLGNFQPTTKELDCEIKGWMADDDGIGKVYLTSTTLRDLAEDMNTIAQWLDERATEAEATALDK